MVMRIGVAAGAGQGGSRAPHGCEAGTGGTCERAGGDPAPILARHPRVRESGINHLARREVRKGASWLRMCSPLVSGVAVLIRRAVRGQPRRWTGPD
jgi:hypothetical protein